VDNELVGEMLVVNAAAHAALRRVFLSTRVRRHDSELTIAMAVDGESAPASLWRESSRRKTHRPPAGTGGHVRGFAAGGQAQLLQYSGDMMVEGAH
jgi:hypothetical protein